MEKKSSAFHGQKSCKLEGNLSDKIQMYIEVRNIYSTVKYSTKLPYHLKHQSSYVS